MAAIHVSLDVSSLENSLAFYTALFGEPAKRKPDYAKFVGRSPEIHLALQPSTLLPARRGPLSHLGIRVDSVDEVRRRHATLSERGLAPGAIEHEGCCYALQEKFWLADPDGNRWEIYTVLEDLDAEASCGGDTACCRPA
ncbi:MAG TPA: ArsI/CadI family heavy metal resistance metalloenzyme [Thermoanaerobaculia bacterium]|nr:ArsI/CadI family heavy metal resistance metalloenzyme [Thermoanaerobaculia bacterium]